MRSSLRPVATGLVWRPSSSSLPASSRLHPTPLLLQHFSSMTAKIDDATAKMIEELFFSSKSRASMGRVNKGGPERTRRAGAVAMKVGMIGVYDSWGVRHACTVLQLDSCQVVQVKTEETDGHTSLQLGAGEKKPKNVNKPDAGHFAKAGVLAKRKLWEFRVSKDAVIPAGTPILAQHFVPGQLVDVCGISKGKGFTGPMKRWGFAGLPASHGTSISHRSHGSTGQNTSPGRVFKGKKMAGRMGNERVTVQNLWLYKIDTEHNLLYIKGHVPGTEGSFVRVTDAVKGAKSPSPVPMPTFIPEEGKEYPKEIEAPAPAADPLTPPEGSLDD